MNAISFRRATLADLPTLLQFEQGIVIAERPMNLTIKGTDVSYYDIGALIQRSDAEVVVGVYNQEIIASGYALIKQASSEFTYDKYVHLGFMYVEPNYRGRGINQLLIEQLTDWARQQNVLEIRLRVYTENEAAIRAYEKVGFESLMLEMRLDLNK